MRKAAALLVLSFSLSECFVRTALPTAPYLSSPARQYLSVSQRATVSDSEAQKVVALARRKLSGDGKVKREIGKLVEVTSLMGSGSPEPGIVAVRFNAKFSKEAGNPMASLFGGAKKDDRKPSRGVQISSVSAKARGAKLVSLSIFKDGGWGASLEIPC